MALTSVIELLPTDPRWISLVESHARAGIFHHPAWSQLLAECYGYRPFVLARAGATGCLEAGIPFMEVHSAITGRRWVSLPFSDYCSPIYADESGLQDLAGEVIRLAAAKRIDGIELRGRYPEQAVLHARSPYVIHEIDLLPGERKVWQNVHEMHRRNVRIAKENDVTITRGTALEDLKRFYDLHVLTRRQQGVPVQPWRFFRAIQKLLLDQHHGFLLLAHKDGQCIAGAVFLHFNGTLTYKYGASSEDGLKYRPNNLVMWTAIEWACSHGFRRFDLGRTDPENTGLRSFKSRWGAEEKSLFYTYSGGRPVQDGNGRLEHYMHIILRKSPTWVCRLSGELLYSHFG